ncbi:MAG: 1-deoxy-D-xylulose-5-phosphate reductoisomerase [Candidatus Kapabacteria bacterium]|nr:1-deoxy-D-xylulose-5-phosphate reductoisomerase [Candidatus Kapabacteria bacterium]
MKEFKKISILGSTGSIGLQSLEVIDLINDNYKINFLTANTKIDLLAKQVEKYHPVGVAISDEASYWEFKRKYNFDCKVLCGEEGVAEAAAYSENDIIIQALVGFSGVKPTLEAISNKIKIALANKETLVSAGKLITEAAKKQGVEIIAIDSEHSAILQCIIGEKIENIKKIVLTASGGPFFRTPFEDFKNLSVEEALNHPNWQMGNKITIDSATLMNKGFEVIEAHWLFGLKADQIEVIIHPQSIVHSFVHFVDSSVKAQLGLPDMKIPIAYALSYPNRIEFDFEQLDMSKIGTLEFYEPDLEKFRCLNLAYKAMNEGGDAPIVLNAANEIAVQAFLDYQIPFDQIPLIIELALENRQVQDVISIEDINNVDKETRIKTKEIIKNLRN